MIPFEKRDIFDKELIEDIYIKYQSHEIDDSDATAGLQRCIVGKKVLVLAPGNSIKTYAAEVGNFISVNEPFTISVNFVPQHLTINAVFISNSKRFESLSSNVSTLDIPVFVTSNILLEQECSNVLQVNYSALIGHGGEADNAGTMLLRFLKNNGVKEVFVAGFDGFSMTAHNFYEQTLDNSIERTVLIQKNEAIGQQISILSEQLVLKFITPSLYERKVIT
jgi:4-hydroxy 2-oxovalerate aldolase